MAWGKRSRRGEERLPEAHRTAGVALAEGIDVVARVVGVEVGLGLALVDQPLELLLGEVIPDVLVQVRIRVVLAQLEVGVRLRDVTLAAVRAAVQVVQASDVLLVLVDAVLDVLFRLGHDPVVVPAELGPAGRLVRCRLLPELAHAGLLGHVRHRRNSSRLSAITGRCPTLTELVLYRGSRYQRVRRTSR
uniref:(northern house mosquito) hypothetical protein n=1 Tax=Culex pipiens TaxID=7175 RepID=A0A8D7ZX19_CULPI